MALHNEIGIIGEAVAAQYLKGRGASIIDRNYRKKWGEIDIVTRETDGRVHFVEVKSVSYETKEELEQSVPFAGRKGGHETHRPEENVHKDKQNRLKRAIQTWMTEKHYTGLFQIDICAVYLVPREKYARVSLLENVIFE